jgi:23S rRNA (uracil1939-C5)-methyltransferase
VHGVVVVENDRRDGAIVPSGGAATVLHGQGHLVEQLGGVPVEVGAGEFLQVNRAQASAMYARVTELAEAHPEMQAIDLFAGLGGIGLHLARAGASVIAVEIDRDAVGQLRRAAQRAGLPLTAIAGDVGDIRGQLGARPDVVVVNPPRKGLSGGARGFLAELAAPTLIYVSCGPEALGRDVIALAGHGYTPDAIEPFDLMPGTSQVETLLRLRRRSRARTHR